uniref:Uncharacterized protein n=1 Tax=Branchiostoma floridae TaxID=7739 RepID=C3Z2G8_BRAFL|eukprot:XP_002597207.1 hypothetical protein BRAFLDRAFT_66334 [Branchiostoma floridae]
MWETKAVPADLKDATIITISKKRDRFIFGNYHGISLFGIAVKIARILLDRLLAVAEPVLPDSLCGFVVPRTCSPALRIRWHHIDIVSAGQDMSEECPQPDFLARSCIRNWNPAQDPRFRDQLKATILRCDTKHTNWKTLAENRTIIQGTDHMEQHRRCEAEILR